MKKEFEKILLKIQKNKFPVFPRKPEFRVSSLPFCGLLHVLEHHKRTLHDEFSSNFYFKVGTALHELWQEAAANAFPNQVLADWRCTKIINRKNNNNSEIVTRCNRIVEFSTLNEARKIKCLHKNIDNAECRLAQSHQEFSYTHKELSGHSDLVFKHKNKYHLWDFKTTSDFLFDKPNIAIGRGYYPNLKYIEQLEAYVVLFERKYKIKLASYSIIYISRQRAEHTRDKPAFYIFNYKITNEMRNKRRKLLKTYQNRYSVAQNWLESSNKNIDKLWDSRPCLSRKDYLNKMKIGFFKDCPQLEKCLSGKLKKQIMKFGETYKKER